MRARRVIVLVIFFTTTVLLLFVLSQRRLWQRVPQKFGLGRAGPTTEELASGKNIIPDARKSSMQQSSIVADINASLSRFPAGEVKPVGSNYTRALVIASMKEEDTTWVKPQLRDMIESGLLSPRIYVVNDRKAPLRVHKNKGHEVMVYLTYIIDNYESLPDISIFMHAHQYAWHNNEIIDGDAAQMVRYLSPERVTRQGYMNLRCHWYPGCPDWLHPGATVRDREKKEEAIIADSWAEVFPNDQVPMVLAQPCCAQFAVSRERILATPKLRYITLRDWISRTPLSDYLSGRVFEYTWHFIFSGASVACPSVSSCYCDGYGVCFGSDNAINEWLDLKYALNEDFEKLAIWRRQAAEIAELRRVSKNGRIPEEAVIHVPEIGLDEVLEKRIAEAKVELNKRRANAFEKGKDPKQRALEAGRTWKKGDGF